ncbi:MAG: hypothetical protein ABI310_01810 [Microbacteriaceae bacterium]
MQQPLITPELRTRLHPALDLGRTKKDVVGAAVRDYVDAHRDEINAGVAATMARLDGSDAVSTTRSTPCLAASPSE